MTRPAVILSLWPETLAVVRLEPNATPSPWAFAGSFFSLTRTPDELSIVCAQANVPANIQAERNWRMLKVAGPLDFALTGILAALAGPLAEAGLSLFALSTYDTDYILVKADILEEALQVLKQAGHTVEATNIHE